MPPVQTAYSDRMSLPSAGTVKQHKDAQTGICETAAGIGFGLAVGQGVGDQGVVLGGALNIFRGVSIKDPTLVNATPDKYDQYQNVGVFTEGQIWVQPGGPVTVGDVVHYNATTGVFSASGGSGPILGARWATSGDAATPAVLELSGFNQQ